MTVEAVYGANQAADKKAHFLSHAPSTAWILLQQGYNPEKEALDVDIRIRRLLDLLDIMQLSKTIPSCGQWKSFIAYPGLLKLLAA
jgi:hypothetical protein